MSGKRRMAVLMAALVVVLAIGMVGQRVLASRRSEAAAAAAQAEAASTSQEDAAAEAIMLADYDATVYTQEGEALHLSDIADDKPLVINFWATWCPYCVEELPDFQEMVSDYDGRVNFAFVDVTDGRRERVEDAAAWLVEQGYDELPAYYDTSLEASIAFGASSLPTTALVAADGEILGVSAGRIDPTLLRAALEELL